jgi:hypothetical protein
LAPEILRLYKWRFKLGNLRFDRRYFCISILYAILGGTVSYLMTNGSNPINSVYCGISLPLVLDAGARQFVSPGDGTKGADRSGVEEIETAPIPVRFNLRSFFYAI